MVSRRPLRPLPARSLPVDGAPHAIALVVFAPLRARPLGPRQRRFGRVDLLAQRIQPDPRTIEAHPLRRYLASQRAPIPVHLFLGRPRRPSFLTCERLTKPKPRRAASSKEGVLCTNECRSSP